MFFTYVLYDLHKKNFYTGYTSNLKKRIKDHLLKKVFSTKYKQELKLIYFEGCVNKIDALRREQYLKSGVGKRYLRSRLRFWFKEINGPGPEKTF